MSEFGIKSNSNTAASFVGSGAITASRVASPNPRKDVVVPPSVFGPNMSNILPELRTIPLSIPTFEFIPLKKPIWLESPIKE